MPEKQSLTIGDLELIADHLGDKWKIFKTYPKDKRLKFGLIILGNIKQRRIDKICFKIKKMKEKK